MDSEAERSMSATSDMLDDVQLDERAQEKGDGIALPAHVGGSGSLGRRVDQARGYAASATAENTAKACKADWKRFASWCRRKGTDPLVPPPPSWGSTLPIGRSRPMAPPLSVSTIERRLANLSANYRARMLTLDKNDRHLAKVWAGIKRTHRKQPEQKEVVLIEDVLRVVGALSKLSDAKRVNFFAGHSLRSGLASSA